MHLPEALSRGIEQLSSGISLKTLTQCANALSEAYRGRVKEHLTLTSLQKLAYLHVRMPATFGALYEVFLEVARLGVKLDSLVDVGSGPGTALFAALEVFPKLRTLSAYEKDGEWIQISRQLFSHYEITPKWIPSCLHNEQLLVAEGLVASYLLNELPASQRDSVIEAMWAKTERVLILIEPGTPEGFAILLKARSFLIERGGFVVAPCTHSLRCPMEESSWCHFSARIERSSFHRQMKGGSLNFEDEKFCYCVVAKEKMPLSRARIVGRIVKEGRGAKIQECSKEGLQEVFVKEKVNKLRLGQVR